jgi:hypothetical protein
MPEGPSAVRQRNPAQPMLVVFLQGLIEIRRFIDISRRESLLSCLNSRIESQNACRKVLGADNVPNLIVFYTKTSDFAINFSKLFKKNNVCDKTVF